MIRRIHMCLAFLLAPWIVMYAVSSIAMNHRAHLRGRLGTAGPGFVKESERDYAASFPVGATAAEKATRILADLGLAGAHTVRSGPGGVLTIVRHDPFQPRRLRFDEPANNLTIEKEPFRLPGFLERLHSRRDYQHNYSPDRAWAVSVDIFIVSMLGWLLSGVWMWLKIRATRTWGAAFAAAGAAVFALFLGTM